MKQATQDGFKTLNGKQRAFVIGMIVWTLLQLSRFIALALIADIDAGVESEAWRYPALLDVFAAVFAVPLAWAIIWRRGLITWSCLVIYWAISIVDHIGNFVTTSHVGPPSIAENASNPYLVPATMTVFDVIVLALLFLPSYRSLFFKVAQ